MIINIDDNFLKLLQQLESLGLFEDIIMVFIIDNGIVRGFLINKEMKEIIGYNVGMCGIKGSEYDGGYCVLFIIRWFKGGFEGGKKFIGLIVYVDMLLILIKFIDFEFIFIKIMDGIDISSYLLGKGEVFKWFLVMDMQ